jgi:murein tripeptide amidase MpaA
LSTDRYYRYAEIDKHLDKLAKEFTSSPKVTVETVGKSYEGREIKIVTITNGDGRAKNSIFIDAGIHARCIFIELKSKFFLILFNTL